jgi:glycosyltransferase involved in cell wall biosynthesis
MKQFTVITELQGTPGEFWGDHTTYFPPRTPGRWLARCIGKDWARRVTEAGDAWRLFRRRDYDAVVTLGGVTAMLFACLQSLWFRKPKPHVLIDCLWYLPRTRAELLVRRIVLRLAARSVYRFVVWASHEVDDYATAFGIPKDKLAYVPHHHTLAGYQYEIRDEGYLFAGGNGDRDYKTLLDAVRPLDVAVVLATTVPQQLDGVPVPSRVKVTGMTHAEFRQAIAACRLMVVAMAGGLLHSGGQQTCLNAMALGKPTIAVGQRWAKDFIADGQSGWIVDYGDVVGLRRAIEFVLQNPAEAAAIARRGQIVAQELTTQRCTEAVYNMVISPLRNLDEKC